MNDVIPILKNALKEKLDKYPQKGFTRISPARSRVLNEHQIANSPIEEPNRFVPIYAYRSDLSFFRVTGKPAQGVNYRQVVAGMDPRISTRADLTGRRPLPKSRGLVAGSLHGK